MWTTFVPCDTSFPVDRTIQAEWIKPIMEESYKQILQNSIDDHDKARLLAIKSQHASDYLNCIPIASLGLKLTNPQLCTAIGLRLGLPLCHPHICSACGVEVSDLGTHGLSCKKSKGRWSRHTQMNNIIQRALTSGGIPSILEPPGMYNDSNKAPDGASLVPYKRGRILVWDFSSSCTLANSYLATTSKEAGKLAIMKENRKLAKYTELAKEYEFFPVIVETLGCFGPYATKLLDEIGSLIVEQTKEPRAKKFLYQRISIALQVHNSVCIYGTLPDANNSMKYSIFK